MKLLRGAHIGASFDAGAIQKLNLDVLHPTAPYHEQIPNGDYGGLAAIGAPILWQASRAGFPNNVYTRAQIKNVIAMPHFCGWWILGNEQDLGFGATPPATPREYVTGIIENMQSIIPLAPAPRRFNLALGSKMAFERGWSEAVLNEMQREAPGILALFDSVSTNYYHSPLDARECVKWLRNFHVMLDRAGAGDKSVWLKELGAGTQQGLGDAGAAKFIAEFFEIVEKRKANGGMEWLELVEWFAATDLTAYQMPYEKLVNGASLTAAGKAWAKEIRH